ncbi:MAG: hypothetical protein M1817_001865 [Caeruleum heppii]|nr:MAG: hypothetical protein M1817_001865 [Caeruleum heppii]
MTLQVLGSDDRVHGPVPTGLESLFNQDKSETDGGDPEARQKRRKVVSNSWYKAENFITVARGEIHIRYINDASEAELTPPKTDWDEPLQKPVIVKSVSHATQGRYRLRLVTLDGEQILDSNICSTDVHKTISDLRAAIKAGPALQGSNCLSSSNSLGVAASIYSLTPEQDEARRSFRLRYSIVWKIAKSFEDISAQIIPTQLRRTLANVLSHAHTSPNTPWSAQDFYKSIRIPRLDPNPGVHVHTPLLRCAMFDFQKRAVAWLLSREGVTTPSETPLSTCSSSETSLIPSFYSSADLTGRECYISPLLGAAAIDLAGFQQQNGLRGGILAEEMGLGKTVEMIALICIHRKQRRSKTGNQTHEQSTTTISSPSTLIITPPSIINQWATELEAHAPSLTVTRYTGLKSELGKLNDTEIVRHLMASDVVLTTYNVIADEIHYTGQRPDRHMRHPKRFLPRQCPLIKISWWRICLDEAQMIESGVSNASTVARLIPRENAWAITGTPVRKDVRDLLGLLVFLRFEPFSTWPRVWDHLIKHEQSTLDRIFGHITLRHTKGEVADELQLPPQKRFVVHLPFTPVEEQNYEQLFQQMCDDCGFDRHGAPTTQCREPDAPFTVENMRMWLTRLRQTCLHPEVGGRNRRALGHSDGPLRSVAEVLEVMIQQNENTERSDERTLLLSRIKRGQVLEYLGRSRDALDVWDAVRDDAESAVRLCQQDLDEERLDACHRTVSREEPAEIHKPSVRNNETALEHETISNDALSENGIGEDECTGTASRRLRLRATLEILHMCTFFAANASFQIKSGVTKTAPDSARFRNLEEAEIRLYEEARVIRTEILKEVNNRAKRLIDRISRKATCQDFVVIPEMETRGELRGIESRRLIERLKDLSGALNDQADQLDDWREAVIHAVTRLLVDQEEGADLEGDEFDRSTKQQDEVLVYLQVLGTVIADRRGALTGERNRLTAHEVKHTLDMAMKGEGHSPELMCELLATRARLQPAEELGSMRAIITELRGLCTGLRWQSDGGSFRASAELDIASSELHQATMSMNEQMEVLSTLQTELNLFRAASNTRIEYYKQLQQISDTVRPWEAAAPRQAEAMLDEMKSAETKLAEKIKSSKAKGRYLLHIGSEAQSSAPRVCVICQQVFEIGALTVCGHQYCKDCMRLWWREHHTCPICKKRLSRNDFYQISYNSGDITLSKETHGAGDDLLGDSSTRSIYAGINKTTLSQIRSIDLQGSFGTKIDMLARHLLWIRRNEPGAKVIAYSQFRDFLNVLSTALSHFRIGHSLLDRKGGLEKFKDDPEIACFLLHAKAHSSGLNLINATHVFLCEPLINTALELQAIARVHRIGQHRATTVWMYLINGTVEEAIYEISLGRRLSYLWNWAQYSTEKADAPWTERTLEAAELQQLQQTPFAGLLAKGSGGGEMVQKEDLWRCLFQKGKP